MRSEEPNPIVVTAQRLFAAHGVDDVSLRIVANEARISPHTMEAVFSSKRQLIEAVLAPHTNQIHEYWTNAIASRGGFRSLRVRELVEIMVLPTIAKLNDPNGGPEYLAIASHLIGHPKFHLVDFPIVAGDAAQYLFEAFRQLVQLPQEVATLRVQRVVSTMFHAVAEYARLQPVVPQDVFASDLIDSLTALISARVSVETLDTLEESRF